MSKMGQKFEDNLNSAKYDLYKALKNIVARHEKGLALGEELDLKPARDAIAKVEEL